MPKLLTKALDASLLPQMIPDFSLENLILGHAADSNITTVKAGGVEEITV